MTIFGNRDSGYTPGAAVTADTVTAAAGVPEEPPAASRREFGSADVRRVVLRVHGDEPIVVGTAEGREGAVRIARETVQHIEQAASAGEWPLVEERFIRPGAIVSVDVQRSE